MSVVDDGEITPYKVESRPSQYKFYDLRLLNDKSTSYKLKLACIAHVDLNAFFAQVEQVRLNLSKDDPVVCVQWQAVIAVSYAARKYGIKRMDTIETCKQKCPNVVLAHAAVYVKGSTSWKYMEKLPFQGMCKVSLDPYRRESRKIFRILGSNCDLVEKASVDEGYLDLGRLVYDKLTLMFPYLKHGEDEDVLPNIPEELKLEFRGHVFTENEDVVICDWDDVITIIGSNIVHSLRKEVYDKLEYTTSGGLSRNKNLAKLAGGMLKPDNQTILLNSQIPQFMKKFEFTEINGMGGKLGEQALNHFSVPTQENSIEYLCKLPKEELSYPAIPNLYEVIHGNNAQPLRDRVDIKSMMSRKQMMNKNPVKTIYDIIEWVKTFAGDLCNRLEDLDEESGVITRPRTISVNLIIKQSSNSKQCPVPVVTDLEKLKNFIVTSALNLVIELLNSMFDLARLNNKDKLDYKNINPFNKIDIPPVHNMAVILSSLVKIESSLDKFTKPKDLLPKTQKGQDATADEIKMDKTYINKLFQDFESRKADVPVKKEKKMDTEYIKKLFDNYEKETSNTVLPTKRKASEKTSGPKKVTKTQESSKPPKPRYNILDSLKRKSASPALAVISAAPAPNLGPYYCEECRDSFENSQEHKDYHFALELSKLEQ